MKPWIPCGPRFAHYRTAPTFLWFAFPREAAKWINIKHGDRKSNVLAKEALSFKNQWDNILLKLFPTVVSPDLALWELKVLRRLLTDLTTERFTYFDLVLLMSSNAFSVLWSQTRVHLNAFIWSGGALDNCDFLDYFREDSHTAGRKSVVSWKSISSPAGLPPLSTIQQGAAWAHLNRALLLLSPWRAGTCSYPCSCTEAHQWLLRAPASQTIIEIIVLTGSFLNNLWK